MFKKNPLQKIKDEFFKYEQKEEERRKKHVKKMNELIEKCHRDYSEKNRRNYKQYQLNFEQ